MAYQVSPEEIAVQKRLENWQQVSRRITALKRQKRNPQRVNVYLDDEFAFGLSRIVAAWLHIGQELSEDKITELQQDDTREVAHQQALKLLNYRARSEKELRRNLAEHGFPEEVTEGVIERLKSNGLLDDSRFAENWVENRSTFRPRSRRALTVELRQRGIQDDTIRKAVKKVDDEEMAYLAAQSYARKLENLDWLEFRQKLAGFLARRGFYYDVVSQVVPRVWTEMFPDKPADEL